MWLVAGISEGKENLFLAQKYVEHVMFQQSMVIIDSIFHPLSRLTVVSHGAKKKQHACISSGLCDDYSELFTCAQQH